MLIISHFAMVMPDPYLVKRTYNEYKEVHDEGKRFYSNGIACFDVLLPARRTNISHGLAGMLHK